MKAIKDFYICLTADHHLILQKIKNSENFENKKIDCVNEINNINQFFEDENDSGDNSSLKIIKKVFIFCFNQHIFFNIYFK